MQVPDASVFEVMLPWYIIIGAIILYGLTEIGMFIWSRRKKTE